MIFNVAKQSLWHRKVSVLMTFFALLVSVSMLISIEHIRKEAKSSFYRTVSGVDLIVGARTGQINLLLSSVFRVGANANSISWASYQRVIADPQVEWSIPLSLGDSHKGFAVIGTTNDYFKYYRFGNKRQLLFQDGGMFEQADDRGFSVVLGADVAKQLNYHLGDEFVISHGVGEVSFSHHNSHPFTVVGILAFTGTPVDQAVHVSLSAIESVHSQPAGALSKGSLSKPKEDSILNDGKDAISHKHNDSHAHHNPKEGEHSEAHSNALPKTGTKPEIGQPTQISAFMLGLKSRIAVLQVQRQVNQDKLEPLSAIIPGVALAELWRLIGAIENVLRIISSAVLIASLLGLSTMLLASLSERKAEISVFRVMGAKPSFVFWLIQIEALSIAVAACSFALLAVVGLIMLSSDWLLSQYGLALSANIMSMHTLWFILIVLAATFFIALIPSIGAYRNARLLN